MAGISGRGSGVLSQYLFGSLTTVSTSDVVAVAVMAVVIVTLCLGLAPQLFAVCADEDHARQVRGGDRGSDEGQSRQQLRPAPLGNQLLGLDHGERGGQQQGTAGRVNGGLDGFSPLRGRPAHLVEETGQRRGEARPGTQVDAILEGTCQRGR